MKNIYIIAGEASGDLHGSNLMKALLQEEKNINFRYWGGDEMRAVKGSLVKHIKDLAFMGFAEVVMNLKTILGNLAFCKKDILAFKPDVLILIDYPGFNLRIADWAKKNNIKVFYYVSPQIWAWKQNRVHQIKKNVDKLYAILPFEKDFYKKFDYEVEYMGHPLLDAIENYRAKTNDRTEFYQKWKLDQRPIIAVLPGSRKQEISKKLPVMLEALESYTNYQIVIAGAPSMEESYYRQYIKQENIQIVFGATYNLLQNSEAAVVTSGTATLETALFEIPEVVCYIANPISYNIAKRLIKIDYISLVNLIMNREVVRELIQADCNPATIKEELNKILIGGSKREQLLKDYKILKEQLGGGGASEKVAKSILNSI